MTMKLISHHMMSLDGYLAGRDDEMDWAFEYGSATALVDETMERFGAIVTGRRWYDLARERWNGADGLYGGAFKGQVIVLTHEPPTDRDEARITFVSGGIEAAMAEAARAAGGRDVGVLGGSLTQQLLRAGRLDEIVLHLTPVLLGEGVRLFDELGRRVELERVSVATAEQLTDLRFRVVS
jgi:dihydrofolate reductase